MVWVNDQTIGDEEVLWRRISQEALRVDPATGEVARRSDGAFRTKELSVHIAALTTKELVLAKYPAARLVGFAAGAVRSLGLIVARDPTPDDPSHAIVARGDDPGARLTNAQARELNKVANWVD